MFLDASSRELRRGTVGALPDLLTFTPDGLRVVVANEGEPAEVTQADVTTVGFGAFADPLDPAVWVFGPGNAPAQDLEPGLGVTTSVIKSVVPF